MFTIPYHLSNFSYWGHMFGVHSTVVWIVIAFACLFVLIGLCYLAVHFNNLWIASFIFIAGFSLLVGFGYISNYSQYNIPVHSSEAYRDISLNRSVYIEKPEGYDSRIKTGSNVAEGSGQTVLADMHASRTHLVIKPVTSSGRAYVAVLNYLKKNDLFNSITGKVSVFQQGTRCKVNTLGGVKTIVAYADGRKTPVKQSKKTIVLSVKKD